MDVLGEREKRRAGGTVGGDISLIAKAVESLAVAANVVRMAEDLRALSELGRAAAL